MRDDPPPLARTPNTNAARLGFGVSGPHGLALTSRKSTFSILEKAVEEGVTHFDTAPFYGDGEAERRLGLFLHASRVEAVVSTKAGEPLGRPFWGGAPTAKDFSPETIRRSVDDSRRRLQLDRIDVLYLHGPAAIQIDEALPALEALVGAGAIGKWGVCGRGPEIDAALARGAGAIMAPYSILDRSRAPLFAAARENGIETAAIEPLIRGFFTESHEAVRRPADLWGRARAFRAPPPPVAPEEMRRRLGVLNDAGPAQVALAFALANRRLDTVYFTTTKAKHLAENLGSADIELDDEAVRQLNDLFPETT